MLGIVIQGRKAAHEGLSNLALLCSRERISQAQQIHSVFIKILPSCWWLMIDLEFREDARGRGGSPKIPIWVEFRGHPHPHGGPQQQQGHGLTLEQTS